MKALRNGKPLKANATVLKAVEGEEEEDEREKVAEGWIEPEDTSVKLTPGVCEARLESLDRGDEKLIEAAAVEAGRAETVAARFREAQRGLVGRRGAWNPPNRFPSFAQPFPVIPAKSPRE